MKTSVAAFASAAVLALAVSPRATVCADGEDASAKPPATRTFRFEYATKVKPPEGGKRLEAWIPLPLEDDLQKVAGLTVLATLDGKPVAHEVGTDAPYGNRIAHVVLDAPKGELSFGWSATITRAADRGQGAGPVLGRFKEADRLVPITGRAAALAKEVVDGAAGESVDAKARRVYEHVLATMVYDKQAPGWGQGDFERACEVGKGNCTDFHAKFTGIARAAGIPVRFTMGIPLSTDAQGAPGGYHCWAHFHDGTSWIPVDISEAQKVQARDAEKARWFYGHLDPDRIALSVGRDLTLVPKQKGPPLLFFAYPYVEVDDEPFDLPKESRSFAFENP